MGDITTRSEQAIAAQGQQSEGERLLTIIADAASNPNVDVAKMQALLEMQERIVDRGAKQAWIEAMAAMQQDLPMIARNGAVLNKSNQVQSRFSRWEDIHRIIKPILMQHGFSLTFRIGSEGQMTTVEAVLAHVRGHVESSGAMRLPLDASGGKNAVQGTGSTVSYGKRYTTIAMLNIVTGEDDDGQQQRRPESDVADSLLDDGETAARNGVEAYRVWFEGLTKEERRELAATGDHQRLKDKAAKQADDETDGGKAYIPPTF